ncbi:tyrosine-type recombinase/integrase [Chromobacterium phragmitis]|uniref:tyrosine-type recombinase/integrase n=1 Tax=Chromobacterium phragmitis TaxID=2202141 RepID=UPI0038781A65
MLSDTKARQAKPTDKVYRIADAKGLALEVRPSGQKFWRYRFRFDGKPSMFTIGEYPAVGLAEARRLLEDARALVERGINPNMAKRIEKANQISSTGTSFSQVANEWISAQAHWTDGYRSQVEKTLRLNAFPKIGDLPISEITPAIMLSVIQPVIDRGAVAVARNLRQWSGAVFRYGVTTLRCASDPTAPLGQLVKRVVVRHHPPLAVDSIPNFLKALDAYKGYGIAQPAAQLMLLTFVRTAEIRSAEWCDIDWKNRLWRIPGEKMKMSTDHIVPLSAQALAILEKMKLISGNRNKIFPNARNPADGISPTTINTVIASIGFKNIISGHGFRSTASTMLHELGYDERVIEIQLAHMERNKVKAAYNHAKHLDKRRKMMQDYADYLDRRRSES